MIELQRQDEVFVLTMKSGENRFNREFLTRLNDALDEVEGSAPPAALVTVGEGRFYSNGLDLDWLTDQEPEITLAFLADFEALFARLLMFPMITVAALNGHAFAGGAMFSLSHDFRIMRRDRGFWCLPEVDLGMPLRAGMNALIAARLPKATFHESIVTGRRYGAEAALAASIVQDTAPEVDVLGAAIAMAAPHVGKNRETVAALKRGMYADAISALQAGQPHPSE